MKVLAINGSPRRGNTEAMLKKVLDGAREAKAQIELVNLREMKIEHCGGCQKCEETGSCRKEDEMMPLYGKLIEADTIVFGSPNYFNNVSGIMKDFIDRTNPFYKSKSLKGKRLYLLVVGGDEPEACAPVIDSVKRFANFHEMNFIDTFAAKALMAGDIEKQKETIKKLKQFGEKLA